MTYVIKNDIYVDVSSINKTGLGYFYKVKYMLQSNHKVELIFTNHEVQPCLSKEFYYGE